MDKVSEISFKLSALSKLLKGCPNSLHEYQAYKEHLNEIGRAKLAAKQILHTHVPENDDLRKTPMFKNLMVVLDTKDPSPTRSPEQCAALIMDALYEIEGWYRNNPELKWFEKWDRWLVPHTSLWFLLKWKILWPVIRAFTFERWAIAKLLLALATGFAVFWLILPESKSEEVLVARIALGISAYAAVSELLDKLCIWDARRSSDKPDA